MSDDDMYDFGGGHAAPKPSSRPQGRDMKAKAVSHAAVHKSPAKSTGGDDDDDYGDDDFEDYGDDFEDDEEETQASAPAPAPAPAPAAASRKIDISKVAGNSNSNVAEEKMPASQMRSDVTSKSKGSKGSSRGAPVLKDLNNKMDKENTSGQTHGKGGDKVPKLSAATRRKVRQFSSMSMSSNPSNFGSGFRAKRLQKLYAAQVMDLQEEKFTNFHIPAVSPMDGYLRKLRAADALIKQSGVPAEDETRSVEVATEDTSTEDKGVQFCYGDDTDLLLIMDRITRQKEAKKRGVEMKEDDTAVDNKKKTMEASTISTQTQLDDESYDQGGGTTRLNSFLQSAAHVCERLIEEDAMQNPERRHIDRSSTHDSLFSDDSQWTSVAANMSGATELIRMRKITSCKFSILQPQLLLTMHPYDEKDEDDLMPYKGLFCVWNVTTPSAPPNFVLVGAGNPSCCSFSSTQTFLICAGTDEGTLHLWDLREASALHRDRDAIDLGIDRGIRKACYSTATLIDGTVSLDLADSASSQQPSLIEGGQHAAPITQLVAIGVSESNAASTSQFASMDQTGLICLWVTGLQHTEDVGLSPWGKVALVFTRSLHVNHPIDEASFLTSSVLAAVPGDVSTLLAAAAKGSVKKVVRFGNAPSPQSLNRSEASTIEIAFNGRSSASDKAFSDVALYADVTTISVQAKTGVRYRSEAKDDLNTSTSTPIPTDISNINDTAQLVLVGRADGSIDLFKMDIPTPLQTWKLSQLLGIKDRSASNRSIPSVAVVQWIPNKHSAFLIIDTEGNCFLFDLLLSPHNPLCTERLSIAHTQVLDLSPCRNGSTVAYLAALGEDGGVKVRPLWEGWLRSSPDDPFRLLDSLSLWSLRTVENGGKLSFEHAESK